MTSNGNDTFLKEKYNVGGSTFNDINQALSYYLVETTKTSGVGNIEVIRYWDFG